MKKYNEIRHANGKPDDIVLDGGDMHLEDMDGKVWWLGFYRGKKRTSFILRSKSEITVEIQDNDLKAKLVDENGRKKVR